MIREYNILWPLSDDFKETVKAWAEILLKTGKFSHKTHGEDFFTDYQLNEIEDNNQIVITRWIDPPSESFYCITGWGLYEFCPWWKTMHEFFEDKGLKPWLAFPCILISRSKLPKHSDIGRPTALNYPIFGEESMGGYFWPDKNADDDEYIKSYSYETGKTLLLDTTKTHGGLPNRGYIGEEPRAIFNMGFDADFDKCKLVLDHASDSDLFGL